MEQGCGSRTAPLWRGRLTAGRRLALLGAGIGLGFLATPAAGEDVFGYVGRGTQVDAYAVGLRTPVLKSWPRPGGSSFNFLVEGEAGVFHARQDSALHPDIVELGVKPVLRWYPASSGSLRPYTDFAIGVHLLSHTEVNADRRFSTAFQFGEHIAAGVQFCEAWRCSLALRVEHISNAHIKEPNNGMLIGSIQFGYHF